MQKEIDLLVGKVKPPHPKPKPRDSQALDVLIDVYLTTGKAAEKNWRKHTLQAYVLSLKLFCESCKKTRLEEIEGDDLRAFKVFLRKYRTKAGKPYDPRSIWNHFNNFPLPHARLTGIADPAITFCAARIKALNNYTK
jgi:hypothetical protein